MKTKQCDFESQSAKIRSWKTRGDRLELNSLVRKNSQTQQLIWQRSVVCLFMLLAGVAATSLAGCSRLGSSQAQEESQVQPSPPTNPSLPSPSQETNLAALPSVTDPNFVVAAVQKVGPAVVRINASRTVSRRLPEFLMIRSFDDFSAYQMYNLESV